MPDHPLACRTATRRRIEVSGLALSLLESGTQGRPPLCLLHGGAAHAHWFDAVTPALVDRFHVVALDQRGHGESAWAGPPAYGTRDFAADLLGVMDRLGWTRITLVGHSIHITLDRPRAFAAILRETLEAAEAVA